MGEQSPDDRGAPHRPAAESSGARARETLRRLPIWAFVSLAWVGPAFFAALRPWLVSRFGGNDPFTWKTFTWEAGDWLLYGALTPGVFWLARRFPLERGRLATRIPLHLALSMAFCGAWTGGGMLLHHALFGTGPYGQNWLAWFTGSLPFGVAVYFAVLGAEHAVFFFLQSREREVQAARLQAQLSDARLGALRMQLQPHFLFNSLNALGVIVRDRDTATATRMLEQLGDMLRRVMRKGRPPEVRLSEELEFLQQYLAIEQIRFPDRLRPAIDADPALLGAAVPEFILQPLVENAIRHGLARRVTATMLKIEARRDGADLVLAVTNDGPDPDAAPAERGEGVGIANTRERLATLYGDRASFTLVDTPGGGAVATIRLPWRELANG